MYQQQPYQQPLTNPGVMPGNPLQVVPRARPLFRGGTHAAQNGIRGYYDECCCGMRPGTGPNVPPHWLDGGHGWATAHFFDVEPFDFNLQTPGRHQCKYCNFVADGEEGCCGKGACWCPLGLAPFKMVDHLAANHGLVAPPMRDWATSCTDTEGLCDACFCWQCQASRQINAAHGYINQLNPFWCLYFTCAGGRHHDHSGQEVHVGCHCMAAFLTRQSIKQLNRIDEDCCTTLAMSICCPICSLAQTYREFSASGVWPGGICVGDAPPMIAMNNPPANWAPPMAVQPQTGGYQKVY